MRSSPIWPENGDRVYPFASSVDNGWLAAGLIVAANAVPELHDRAWALAESMDFGCYYDPNAKADVGLIRGGFWATDDAPGGGAVGDYCGMGEDVLYTGHHYGAFNTEPRIASLHRHRDGPDPGRALLRWVADVPGHVRLELAGDEADR